MSNIDSHIASLLIAILERSDFATRHEAEFLPLVEAKFGCGSRLARRHIRRGVEIGAIERHEIADHVYFVLPPGSLEA